jgi:hypothetical protein
MGGGRCSIENAAINAERKCLDVLTCSVGLGRASSAPSIDSYFAPLWSARWIISVSLLER